MPALVTYKGRLLTFFDRTSENDGASVPVVHAAAVSVPSGDYVRVCSVLDAGIRRTYIFLLVQKNEGTLEFNFRAMSSSLSDSLGRSFLESPLLNLQDPVSGRIA